jgi:hypothetical protein
MAFLCHVAAALVALNEGRLDDARELLEDLGGFERTPRRPTAKTDKRLGTSLEEIDWCE